MTEEIRVRYLFIPRTPAGSATTRFRRPSRRAFSLASPPRHAYNRRAMTKRKHIDVSVYILIVLLICFFLRAVWGVLGMIGVVG